MNGLLVRSWMQENGIRAEELAVKLNISFQTVRGIMSGRKPHQHTVVLLANLMGMTADQLLTESKKPRKMARSA